MSLLLRGQNKRSRLPPSAVVWHPDELVDEHQIDRALRRMHDTTIFMACGVSHELRAVQA